MEAKEAFQRIEHQVLRALSDVAVIPECEAKKKTMGALMIIRAVASTMIVNPGADWDSFKRLVETYGG